MTTGMRSIGSKTFSPEDQRLFAELSGDRNPMHTDPIAARRLITGRQVVHGIHIMLTALEHRQHADRGLPTSIDCSFSSAVCVGDPVDFAQGEEADSSILEASVNRVVCTRIILTFAPQPPSEDLDSQGRSFSGQAIRLLERVSQPLNEAPEFFRDKWLGIALDIPDASAVFARSRRYLGMEGLASTLALSYMVGMVCPGLHSVFSSFNMDLLREPAGQAPLCFTLSRHDPRFGLFEIRFTGPVNGLIRAFRRPPALLQPSVLELKRLVDAAEFASTRSLVIGGSRGLGEVTAKLLAAGGGDTVITYASGAEDARNVQGQISAETATQCQAAHLDLATQGFEQADFDWRSFGAIYYFATPRIYRKKLELFDAQIFREFIEFYVSKFHDLCVFLENRLTGGKVNVYFPSTRFIDERPKGLAEYAMAKLAAEVLIREINRSMLNVTVHSTRLPRLSTDQTTSIVKLGTGSNAETLLPVIRSMQSR